MVDYFIMIRRHITDHLLQALADTPVALVNGARQTGKSTLVQSAELIEQGRHYLTFDDPGVLGAAKLDPNGFTTNDLETILRLVGNEPSSCNYCGLGRATLASVSFGRRRRI
jgi:hypothetical protein